MSKIPAFLLGTILLWLREKGDYGVINNGTDMTFIILPCTLKYYNNPMVEQMR
jgi:hypothetical protein